MAGGDVKERLMDTADEVRQALSRFVEDFKERTPFFKARLAVVAGYVVLVVLSLVLLPPAGEYNPLGAKVKVSSISFGSREKTFVELSNESDDRWEDATITIAGTCIRNGTPIRGVWTTSQRFRPGETRQLLPEKFKDAKGFRPELDVKVEKVTIQVGDIRYVKDLTPKKGGRS